MAYDDVERSVMNRMKELHEESINALPKTTATAQAKSGPTAPTSGGGWGDLTSKLLTGLGAGMQGFAKYYSAARGGNAGAFDDLEDGLSKILEKRKKQREENEAAGAASASASSSPSVGTTDNTVAVSTPSFSHNAWNNWANQKLIG